MYPGPSTAKMELFVVLASSFQPLTNFTKNPNIDAMGALNAPEICAGVKLNIAEL